MRTKRHTLSPFNLSFLDIMFCGFGAVVLLVLILDTDMVRSRNETHANLRAQLLAVEKQVAAEQERLSQADEALNSVTQTLSTTVARAAETTNSLQNTRSTIEQLQRETQGRHGQVEQLSGELKTLEEKTARLRVEEEERLAQGTRAHPFPGQGDRQYLTGLKLGGKRILILLDVSASMLDETLVNIIRRRNMDDTRKRAARKWQRALASAEWLLANLPGASRFQIHAFNTRTKSLFPGRQQWLEANDPEILEQVVNELQTIVPDKGTSLAHAFSLAAKLQPQPDNILLLTDGLPTQGKSRPSRNRVAAKQRLALFESALKQLPKGVPVNTLLFPMEGDAYAAAAFWELAINTGGSFMTPSSDWP